LSPPAKGEDKELPANLLGEIAFHIYRLPFLDMGPLGPEHTGVAIEIVFLVFASMIHQEILFFRNELQNVVRAVFKCRCQLYRQSRTRLLAKSSVDAAAEIDPEPRGIAPAVLTLSRFHGNTTHGADP